MSTLLGIEASGAVPSVAIWRDGECAQRSATAEGRPTGQLLPLIHDLCTAYSLTWKDFDAMVLGIGPGRFTGLRVAMGLLQGLALPDDLPMVGVSSLQVLAHQALAESDTKCDYCVALTNAYMGELFVGVYQQTGDGVQAVVADAITKPDALTLPFQGQWIAAGEGWGVYPNELAGLVEQAESINTKAMADAGTLVRIGQQAFQRGETQSLSEIQPNYLRLAEAWKRG